MSVRELVALGTSAEIPTAERAHHASVLRWDAEGLLIDPGEGAQRQLIFAEITATSITKVLLSHFHGTHCLGLSGICQRISLDRVPQEVDVFFPASGEATLERLIRASIYHNMAKIRPRPVHTHGVVHQDSELSLTALPLDHTVDTLGFRVAEPDGVTMLPERLAAAGIRGRAIGELQKTGAVVVDGALHRVEDYSVRKRGQSVAFIMDTRPCEGALELAKDADLLICASTFLHEHEAEARARKHLTAREAAELAGQAGASKLVLTHFAPRYPDVAAFEAEARQVFAASFAARDLDRFLVERRLKGGPSV